MARALQKMDGAALSALQSEYTAAMAHLSLVTLQLQLADVEFELSKREGFVDDPALPGLVKRKAMLEAAVKEAMAATRPANTR